MRHRLRVKLVILGLGSTLTAAALAACSIDIDGTGVAPADSGPLADVTVPKLDATPLDAAPYIPDAGPLDAAPDGADADAGDAAPACGAAYGANNAAHFTGDPSGYIDVSRAVATGDFTLEAWIAPASITGDSYVYAGNQLFIADVPGGGHNDWGSYLYTPTVVNAPVLAFTTGIPGEPDSLGFTNDASIPQSAAAMPKWTHVAIVRSESMGTVRFYINGQENVDTPDASTMALADGNYLAIGGSIVSDSGPENGFDGLIDEVRVWNYDRTHTDIATDVVDELCGTQLTDTKLVLYYKLDESDVDSTVHDSSPTGLDGILMGADGGARPTFVPVTNR